MGNANQQTHFQNGCIPMGSIILLVYQPESSFKEDRVQTISLYHPIPTP
jgi:hypothetical protein